MSEERRPATDAVHGAGGLPPSDPTVLPIVTSVSYRFGSTGELAEYLEDQGSGYLYSRWANPTVRAVARQVAALEGAPDALLFSAGMGAISTTLLGLLGAGDELLASSQLYGESLRVTGDLLPGLGIEVRTAPPNRLADEVRPDTKVVYAETLTNPTLAILDVPRLAAACREAGAKSVVDSTFATPYHLRPLEHGIDLVIHSATKYLGGHGDLTAGVVCGATDALARIERRRRMLGTHLGPHDASSLGKGLKTFPLRMAQHNRGAAAVLGFLAEIGVRAIHPMLPDHPDHALAARLFSGGCGGIVTLELADLDAARRAVDRLELFSRAASLGSAESLVSIPVMTSHHGLTDDQLAACGVTQGMVRLSIGLEDPADLCDDLRRALT